MGTREPEKVLSGAAGSAGLVHPTDFEVSAATPLSRHTRFVAHVNDTTIATSHPSYFRIWELDGLSHDTSDIATLQKAGDDWADTIRDLAKSGRTAYSWLVRERDVPRVQDKAFKTKFATELAKHYYQRLDSQRLYSNRWFFGLEDRMPLPAGLGWLLKKTDKALIEQRRAQVLSGLDEGAAQMAQAALARYGAQPLKTYELVPGSGQLFSEPMEFINYLLSCTWSKFPLGSTSLNNGVGRGRMHSNGEIHEIRHGGRTTFTMQMGIKEYGGQGTLPGILNAFLEAPFECVVAHSFSFISDREALRALRLQRNRLRSTDENAGILIDQLEDALSLVTARQLCYGEHSMVVQIRADNIDELLTAAAEARDMALSAGITLEVENPTSMASLLSMAPGCLRFRPRPAMISNQNFAAYTPFHNFPLGKPTGNHWGDALLPVPTSVGTIHWLNLHVADRGHFSIQGKTGQGKTVVLGLVLAFTEPVGARWFVVDRNRGMEIAIRAMDGDYIEVEPGFPTEWNPFDREPSPESIEFLQALMEFCATRTGPLSLRQADTLNTIVKMVMTELPPAIRGIQAVHDHLSDREDDNGLFRRIQPWIQGGQFGWVFKQAGPGTVPGSKRLFGLDPTKIVGNPTATQAIMMELWDRFKQSRASNPAPLGFLGDEVWGLLNIPYFQKEVEDLERTGRKLNAVVGLATQDTGDLAGSDVCRVVVSQTTTEFYIPSDKYDADALQKVMRLSEREAEVARSLRLDSRHVLLKQGGTGVVLNFNLAGLRELKVLSANDAGLRVLDRLLKTSTDPAVWLDLFYQELGS